MKVTYDYKRQAWIEDGVYVTCEHPDPCKYNCYGKLHAGETAPTDPRDLGQE